MADDLRSNLGDIDQFNGLPWPASPVTASGQDPDEVRLLMGGVAAPETQQQASDAVLRSIGAGAPARPSAIVKPSTSAVASPAPASPPTAAGPATVGSTGAAGGPATLPSVTSNEAQPKNWTSDNAQQGMSQELEAGRRLMEVGSAMQQDPGIAKLEGQVESDAAAAPNPQNYKPGFGTRLLRGLKAVGLGLAEGGLRGALAGGIDPGLVRGGTPYSAPTDAYDIALNANKRQTAQDQLKLSDALTNFKQAQDLRTGQEKAYTDAGNMGKGAATGATDQMNAQTRAAQVPIDQEKADADRQKAFDLSPQGKLKATQAEIEQRTKFAEQMGMPQGIGRIRYILTGQIQAPHQATAEEMNVAHVVEAFRRAHNGQGPQTVADWQGVLDAARGGRGTRGAGMSDPDARASAIVADSVGKKNEFLSGYERQPDGYWVKRGVAYMGGGRQDHAGDVLSGEQMRSRVDQYRLDANKQLAPLGYRMDDQGNMVRAIPDQPNVAAANTPDQGTGVARVNATASPASGQRGNAPGPGPRPGEVRHYKGHPYRWDGRQWNLEASR